MKLVHHDVIISRVYFHETWNDAVGDPHEFACLAVPPKRMLCVQQLKCEVFLWRGPSDMLLLDGETAHAWVNVTAEVLRMGCCETLGATPVDIESGAMLRVTSTLLARPPEGERLLLEVTVKGYLLDHDSVGSDERSVHRGQA